MYKLKLNPQTSGYGVTPGDDVKRQQMDGGRGRYYIDVKRNSHIVDVNWNLSKTDFNKMMAFWRIEPYRVCRRVNILRDYPDDKTKLYPRN